ncbi:hypothetical protein HHI36_007101 [Cryptolaemus montrouzieri]|uniref:Uncharacterized protein n=1 Tax=Cryptolaemus montrouzieri TaxID=559131 RepID=A0ABD2MNZ9_9CUCU
MDLNPLIPNATASHDVAHILSETFEDTIREVTAASNIASNIRKNNVDEDYTFFKDCAETIKQFEDNATTGHTNLQSVELEMMTKQARSLIVEQNIEYDSRKKEHILLKKEGLFQNYPFSCEEQNLINKDDVFPSVVEQSLDFMYKKDLHNCKVNHCLKKVKNKINVEKQYQKILPR